MLGQKNSLTDIDEVVRLSYLYDFYGPLMKEKHRRIFEDYILNDLSLGEIAGEYGITRQGVYDVVRRCSERLEEYEQKLRLFDKFRRAKEKLSELEDLAERECSEEKEQILALTHEIYDMF